MLTFSKIRYLDRFGSQIIRSSAQKYLQAEILSSTRGVWTDNNIRVRSPKRKNKSATVSNDGDTFGKDGVDEDFILPLKSESLPDDDDGYDKLFVNRDRKHILYYKYKLQELIHNNHGKPRIVEALKLFDEMKKTDRKKVQPYMYTMLISGAAENGYTEKAFELFEEALKHKLKPTQATFTSLFNSCAECPFKEMGLEKAEWLRNWMKDIGIQFNKTHYHAMIKAFGKLGDLKTAYELVDEMTTKEIAIDTITFSHLLIGAINQAENGFGEAIKLYRRMRFHKIPRDLHTYNLLLRATRYCGIGDKENFQKLLHEWFNMERILYSEKRLPSKQVKLKKQSTGISYSSDRIFEYLPDGSIKYLDDKEVKDLEPTSENDKDLLKQPSNNQNVEPVGFNVKPNFLISSKFSRMGQVLDIDYDSLKDWKNRFALIGGLEGIIHLLEMDKIKPDIKTFTLMLDLIPDTNESEENLIYWLMKSQIKPDTGFFNQIIKRRNIRGDLAGSKRIFTEMQKYGVPIDISTFGVLAIGCQNLASSSQLLKDLEKSGFKPNIQIIGSLMKGACITKDIDNMKHLMGKILEYNIPADRRIMDVLVLTIEEIDRTLWAIEKGKREPRGKMKNPEYAQKFNDFKLFFKKWAAKTSFEFDQHPWEQFKYDREDWNYYKMYQFEKMMKSKILARDDIKAAVAAGHKINVHKLVYDK